MALPEGTCDKCKLCRAPYTLDENGNLHCPPNEKHGCTIRPDIKQPKGWKPWGSLGRPSVGGGSSGGRIKSPQTQKMERYQERKKKQTATSRELMGVPLSDEELQRRRGRK